MGRKKSTISSSSPVLRLGEFQSFLTTVGGSILDQGFDKIICARKLI
jgi:hypothetical protein